MSRLGFCKYFAPLFRFPEENYRELVNRCQKHLETHYPGEARIFEPFNEFVLQFPPSTVEEVFIRTFEVQAFCHLEVGYVLFGEDYKRGTFMVKMNKEHKAAGNDCGEELADHLGNILNLLPQMKDEQTVSELVTLLLIPALEKMLGEFNPEKLEQKKRSMEKHHKALLEDPAGRGNIYARPLEALLKVFRKEFGHLLMEKEKAETQMENGLARKQARAFLGKSKI